MTDDIAQIRAVGCSDEALAALRDATNLTRRLWGYVVGIRPSILALGGNGPLGADHLGRSGRLAWKLALDMMLHDSERLGVSGDLDDASRAQMIELSNWIREERRLEAFRWTNGENLLRHMDEVFSRLPSAASDRGDLIAVWLINLHDLANDADGGVVRLGASAGPLLDSLEDSVRAAQRSDDAEALAASLRSLRPHVNDEDIPGPPIPLVAEEWDRKLRELLHQVSPFIAPGRSDARRTTTGLASMSAN